MLNSMLIIFLKITKSLFPQTGSVLLASMLEPGKEVHNFILSRGRSAYLDPDRIPTQNHPSVILIFFTGRHTHHILFISLVPNHNPQDLVFLRTLCQALSLGSKQYLPWYRTCMSFLKRKHPLPAVYSPTILPSVIQTDCAIGTHTTLLLQILLKIINT